MSERRACSLASLDRSTFQYEKKRGGDEVLRERLRALANERRRFGYRRLGILLAQEGHHANHKKLYRIYAEEKLAVRRRKGRKRALGSRRPMVMPTRPTERWSLDFVSDSLSSGRRFRILCVVDDFTREALAVMPDFSISGVRLARELDAIIARRGKPKTIVSDNGTEMTSHAVFKWAGERGIEWHLRQASQPRTPSLKVLMGACVTNASTKSCSRPWPTPAKSWPHGKLTTTSSGPTPPLVALLPKSTRAIIQKTAPDEPGPLRLSYAMAPLSGP